MKPKQELSMMERIFSLTAFYSLVTLFAGVGLSVWFPSLWRIPVTAVVVFTFCVVMLALFEIKKLRDNNDWRKP